MRERIRICPWLTISEVSQGHLSFVLLHHHHHLYYHHHFPHALCLYNGKYRLSGHFFFRFVSDTRMTLLEGNYTFSLVIESVEFFKTSIRLYFPDFVLLYSFRCVWHALLSSLKEEHLFRSLWSNLYRNIVRRCIKNGIGWGGFIRISVAYSIRFGV
jgi:hypothetical protein